MDKQSTIEQLKHLGLAPQKRFGQNFLVSESICHSITKTVLSDSSEVIYEIGPGLGALSDFLVESSKAIILVEIDHGLATYLKHKYHDKQNVEIIDKDVLKIDFNQKKLSVVSNLPYYITTSIIEKVVLENKNLVQFVFMVQQELSQRLFAEPKSKEYGPLTILLRLTGTLKSMVHVDRSAFYPTPHVDSSVYAYTPIEHGLNITRIYPFIKSLFLMRRKTLYNNLVPLVKDKEKAKYLLEEAGLSPKVRPEELNPTDFIRLYDCFIRE